MVKNGTMTSKQRFEATCRHQYTDRVPVDYQAKEDVDRRVKEYYGLTSERV